MAKEPRQEQHIIGALVVYERALSTDIIEYTQGEQTCTAKTFAYRTVWPENWIKIHPIFLEKDTKMPKYLQQHLIWYPETYTSKHFKP